MISNKIQETVVLVIWLAYKIIHIFLKRLFLEKNICFIMNPQPKSVTIIIQ